MSCHTMNCFLCHIYSIWKKCMQTFLMVRIQYSCTASLFHGYFSLYQTYSNSQFRSTCCTFFFSPERKAQSKGTAVNYTITFIFKNTIRLNKRSMKEIQLMQQCIRTATRLRESVLWTMLKRKMMKEWQSYFL